MGRPSIPRSKMLKKQTGRKYVTHGIRTHIRLLTDFTPQPLHQDNTVVYMRKQFNLTRIQPQYILFGKRERKFEKVHGFEKSSPEFERSSSMFIKKVHGFKNNNNRI